MNSKELQHLRDHYDTTDTSAQLDAAVLSATVDPDPMVGITVRLPARVLNAARAQANSENSKVTALLRRWIEQAVAVGGAGDEAFVKATDLIRLVASATTDAVPAHAVTPKLNNVTVDDFTVSTEDVHYLKHHRSPRYSGRLVSHG